MNLNEKIRHILTEKNISPSLFADEIGIQRASISHILAERNKPSLDIVQKIIKRFPELGSNWIWDEEELPAISKDTIPKESDNYQASDRVKDPVTAAGDSRRSFYDGREGGATNVRKEEKQIAKEKRVERILIFYSDGTFQEYKPAD